MSRKLAEHNARLLTDWAIETTKNKSYPVALVTMDGVGRMSLYHDKNYTPQNIARALREIANKIENEKIFVG